MLDLTRRDALMIAGACACCAMTAEIGVAADPPPKKVKDLKVGKISDYDKAGFYDKFGKSNRVLIARLDDRLVAIDSTCTHKGCNVAIDAADKTALKCPCHKAQFSPEGTPTGGPAKTALSRLAISKADDGTLTVDTTKAFIESKWDDKDAFIPMEKPAEAK